MKFFIYAVHHYHELWHICRNPTNVPLSWHRNYSYRPGVGNHYYQNCLRFMTRITKKIHTTYLNLQTLEWNLSLLLQVFQFFICLFFSLTLGWVQFFVTFIPSECVETTLQLYDVTLTDDCVIEVTCLWSARAKTILQAAESRDFLLELDEETGSLTLKQLRNYWNQIQGNLHLTGANSCHLIVWTLSSCQCSKIPHGLLTLTHFIKSVCFQTWCRSCKLSLTYCSGSNTVLESN